MLKQVWHCSRLIEDFEEGLGQSDLEEAAIGAHRQRLGRCQQCARVDDTEQRDLLLPDAQHRVIEGRKRRNMALF